MIQIYGLRNYIYVADEFEGLYQGTGTQHGYYWRQQKGKLYYPILETNLIG